MGVVRLERFLRRHRRIFLDTSIFIYQLEANPRYLALTDRVFEWLDQPSHSAVTSTITMMELLVMPYRRRNDQQVDNYYALLSTYPGLDWIAPSLEIADSGARIRATHSLKTPDALQAATAIQAEVTGLVTNDSVFERVEGFETIVLEKLL